MSAMTAALTLFTGCVEEPSPFNPRLMQQWERAHDSETKTRPLYPLPTTQESRFVPGESEPRAIPLEQRRIVPDGPPVNLTLQEIIHRAVLNNLDIRVAGYDTAIDQTRVMEAEARFDPTMFTNFQFERVNKESPGIFSNFDPNFSSTTRLATFNQSVTSTFQIGIQEDLPVGGQVKLQYQIANQWTRPAQFPVNPFYENELLLQLTQPLLQNFGVEVNRARITISKNNQRVSLMDFRKTVEDQVLQVEKTYWQLVQAQRDVDTQQRLVEESEATTDILFHRQQDNTNAVQIRQGDAATKTRRAQLVRARAHVVDLSDQLKQLMNDPSFPVAGSLVIHPANDDTELPMQFNVQEQIETGLENRLELGQQQVRIDSAEIAMHVAKNNLLPQLNFQGSVTSDGVGRDLYTSFDEQSNFSHIGFAAGFQFQYPLGNRAARAIWARALGQREQAIYSYGSLIDKVILDVKTAAREVETSWNEMAETRAARLANEDTLERFQQQQDVGALPYTPESVQLRLDYQERLALAEQAEHQAMFNYNFAIANLEKAKGTVLRYNNVILEEQQLPFDLMHQSKSWGRK
jgi:outer membrane protein TolC